MRTMQGKWDIVVQVYAVWAIKHAIHAQEHNIRPKWSNRGLSEQNKPVAATSSHHNQDKGGTKFTEKKIEKTLHFIVYDIWVSGSVSTRLGDFQKCTKNAVSKLLPILFTIISNIP